MLSSEMQSTTNVVQEQADPVPQLTGIGPALVAIENFYIGARWNPRIPIGLTAAEEKDYLRRQTYIMTGKWSDSDECELVQSEPQNTGVSSKDDEFLRTFQPELSSANDSDDESYSDSDAESYSESNEESYSESDGESCSELQEEPEVYRRDLPPCLDPVELCKILLDGKTDYKEWSALILLRTAKGGNPDEFKMLVEHGLNPRFHGDVCLLKAARNLHYDLVRYMLSLGLNPRAWNSAAWETDDEKMLEILREGERSYKPSV